MMATARTHELVQAAAPHLRQIEDPTDNTLGLRRFEVVTEGGELRGAYLLDEAGVFRGGSVVDKHGVRHAAISPDGFCAVLMFTEKLR